MTFEEMQAANATIKTIDLKGKPYAEVKERVKAFRRVFPNGEIRTELISNADGACMFRAMVFDDKGTLLGTGHAYEVASNYGVNKTSHIENCETSAVGRALGFVGFGIDTAIASYEEMKRGDAPEEARTEEVNNAVVRTTDILALKEKIARKMITEEVLLQFFKKKSFEEFTFGEWSNAMQQLDNMPDKEKR